MLEIRKAFYGDGSVRSVIPYEGDKIHGVAEYFHANGFVKCRIPYSMGHVIDGVVPVSNADGEIFRFDTWKDDRCVSRNTEGVLIGEYSMINGNTIGEEHWYYPSGALQEVATQVNGDYEGVCKRYYEDGILQSEFNYKNGMRNGSGKGYNELGNLMVCSEYKDGLRHGVRQHFWDNGKLAESFTYNEGRIVDGDVPFYDMEGNVVFTTHWVDGLRYDYFPSGAVQSQVPYFNGRAQGISKIFYENGQVQRVAVLKDDKINGTETTYYPNGSLESTTGFVNGVRNGKSYHWNENGQLAWETLFIENSATDSKLYHYHENGELFIEIEMNNDLPNGIEKIYHENGFLQAKLPFRNGMVTDGSYPVYDENGELEAHQVWKNNVSRTYYDNGNLMEETRLYKYFTNGRHVEYGEDGELITEDYYYDGVECENKDAFLQQTFRGLAKNCAEFFQGKITAGPDLNQAALETFFKECYESAMASEEASKEYSDYEELIELPPTSEMSDAQFIQKMAREFVLRLRLPNDGITELNIIDELQYLVDSSRRTRQVHEGHR